MGRMVERVMVLDAVLSDRRCWWLSPEADKRTFFDVAQETGLGPEEYPHITFRSGSLKTVRCFPDKLPIGIEKEDTSRFVFLYLVNRRIPVDFRQFLIRHHNLLLTLHRWTMRLLVPRRFKKSVALYKAALREELWTPLQPSVSKALETYFRERKEQGGHLGDPTDRYIAKEFRQQGMAKMTALYRAWRREGDVVLWRSSSTSLRDDRMHGCAACEVHMLNAQYLAAHRQHGPGSVGHEWGQEKIASGWPPGFDTLSRHSLTPGSPMTANRVQASLSQQLAASASSRRRIVPPSLSEPVWLSTNQRWRERPHCPASPLAPACRDGVVHAIVGRVTCRRVRALFVQEKRAALVPMCVPRILGTM